jgi:deoxyribose-phosphate aldolase
MTNKLYNWQLWLNVVVSNFKELNFASVFVKSSTGFYITENGLPNGATIQIILMLENATPLPVKAAGGVRDIWGGGND